MSLLKLLAVPILAASYVVAAVNQLQEVTGFGPNPTNVRMFTYKPTNLVSNPALIVAMHYCTGTAQAYFSGTQYANFADSMKSYMVIYPHAPDSGGCWDVHSTETLTHNAGGDSLGIASMIRYAITNYGVDSTRVYATGTSSGAMMTNVLLGVYPDLIAAGSAWAGVPYSCFAGAGMWNSNCAQGLVSKTAAQWGDAVRSGYPGFTGTRPKMQIWHGTEDAILSYNNFGEAIKQWTNVFGYSTAATTQQNSPIQGWTRNIYGPKFQAISAQGVGHDIPVQASEVLAWFGLTGGYGTTTVDSSPGPGPTSTSATPTTTASGPTQTHWGQCGGNGYSGPTVCAAPYTCQALNQWYSQVVGATTNQRLTSNE